MKKGIAKTFADIPTQLHRRTGIEIGICALDIPTSLHLDLHIVFVPVNLGLGIDKESIRIWSSKSVESFEHCLASNLNTILPL
jgi:hypothetical protein